MFTKEELEGLEIGLTAHIQELSTWGWDRGYSEMRPEDAAAVERSSRLLEKVVALKNSCSRVESDTPTRSSTSWRGAPVPPESAANLRCEDVIDGLRDSECTAVFRDVRGRRHFLRVERDFLFDKNGVQLLPVGVVGVDAEAGMALIELQHEAETGVRRLWVRFDQLDTTPQVTS